MADYILHTGDCRQILQTLPERSVDCCVTSPPYFGLRDYGMADQIGLEQTPDAYVAELVAVFREVRRVLRDDGTLWLNLGDSYAAQGGGHGGRCDNQTGVGAKRAHAEGAGDQRPRRAPDGIKPKDLIGIPWRVAFALQADGWYLRQDIIWSKPNPMPESVTDRCTKAHEYIFLLSKSERYFFGSDAIKEPSVGANLHDVTKRTKQRGMADTFKRKGSKREQAIPGQSVGTHREDRPESAYDLLTRNRRSVWTVATQPYAGAHFATFPPKLIEPCILAGCPVGGTVLDPFSGSGTTGQVALSRLRNYIGCELNPEYQQLAQHRLHDIQPSMLSLLNNTEDDDG